MPDLKNVNAERFAMLARGRKPYSHRQVAESFEVNIRSLRDAIERRKLREQQAGQATVGVF